VRLLSLFHLALPVLLLWALRRVGYHRRALVIQSVVAAILIALGRFVGPGANVNFAWRDPFFHRSWGPAPLHVLVIFTGLLVLVYVPTHAALSRGYPSPRKPQNELDKSPLSAGHFF
jgi:hypothetical protein